MIFSLIGGFLKTYRIYALIVAVVLIAAGLGWLHHHIYQQGADGQKAIDDAAYAISKHNADLESARKLAVANQAEHAHDQELSDLRDYRDAHPVGPVRLCLNKGSGRSPGAGAAAIGLNAGTGTASGPFQPVPTGDPDGGAGDAGPDISGMLEGLLADADQVSAELREYQARKVPVASP